MYNMSKLIRSSLACFKECYLHTMPTLRELCGLLCQLLRRAVDNCMWSYERELFIFETKRKNSGRLVKLFSPENHHSRGGLEMQIEDNVRTINTMNFGLLIHLSLHLTDTVYVICTYRYILR